jgi:hypothetical protein
MSRFSYDFILKIKKLVDSRQPKKKQGLDAPALDFSSLCNDLLVTILCRFNSARVLKERNNFAFERL